MTEHDSATTEQAHTAAAEPMTTELPPAQAAEQAEAWSLADTYEVAPTHHRGSPLIWSALVALIVAIAGALIFLGTTYLGSRDAKPVPPSAAPPVRAPEPLPSVAPEPPPPSTVTVTAAPSAPAAEPTTAAGLTDNDDAFLSTIRGDGMEVPTLDAAQSAVSNAHQVCNYRANHDEATTQTYAATVTSWMLRPNPAAFTEMAEFHYCGQYLPAGY